MSRPVRLLAILMVLFSGLLMVSSVWLDSPTIDEPQHLRSGYAAVSQFDLGLNSFHPPLWKMIAAVPLLFTGAASGFDMPEVFLAPRIMLITASLVFLWLYFLWVRRRSGDTGAVIGLALLAFSPSFMAQARYVSTDTGAMWGYWAVTAALIYYLRAKSGKASLLLLAALTFALLTKYSTLLLLPLSLLISILWAGASIFSARVDGRERARKGLCSTGLAALLVLLSCCLVIAVYMTVGRHTVSDRLLDHYLLSKNIQRTFFVDLYHFGLRSALFKQSGMFLMGLMAQFNQSMVEPRKAAWLLGVTYQGGSPEFFPLIWFIKEPLGFVILSVAALCLGVSRFLKISRSSLCSEHALGTAAILTVMLAYWFFAMSATINIGVRHILPIFPLQYALVANELSIWIGKSGSGWWSIGRKVSLKAGLLLILLAWGIVSTVSAWPGYISYFNELAGGTKGGLYWASDSNYDWGQDRRRLSLFMDARQIAAMRGAIFLDIPPYLRGRVSPVDLRKGPFHPGEYVAISAHALRDYLCPAGSVIARSARSIVKLFHPVGVREARLQASANPPPFPVLMISERDSLQTVRGECEAMNAPASMQLQPVGRAGASIFVYRVEERK